MIIGQQVDFYKLSAYNTLGFNRQQLLSRAFMKNKSALTTLLLGLTFCGVSVAQEGVQVNQDEVKFDSIYLTCKRVEPAVDEIFVHFSQVAKNSKIPVKDFNYFAKNSFGEFSSETEVKFNVFVKEYMKNIYFSIYEGREAFSVVGEEDLNNSKALFKKFSFSDCIVRLSDEIIPGVDYKKWLDNKNKL